MSEYEKMIIYDSGAVIGIGTEKEISDWESEIGGVAKRICTLGEFLSELKTPDSGVMHQYVFVSNSAIVDREYCVDWLLRAEMEHNVRTWIEGQI